MWWARPSFLLVEVHLEGRRELLAVPLERADELLVVVAALVQFASSEEAMYTRLPSQLCEIMFDLLAGCLS